jgi:hypothetical protein
VILAKARTSGALAAVAALLTLVAACSSSSADPDAASSSTDDSASASSVGSQSSAAPASSAASASATKTATAAATTSAAQAAAQIPLPPVAAKFDYQLGGAYPPPAGVKVVSRDSGDSPAAGIYSICYINAFQAQPDATSWWQSHHPDLLLRSSNGSLVIDQDWNEALLDVSTAAKRAELAQVEYGWIDACAKKGFKGIEPDNLDSYSRSDNLLTMDDNTAFATLLAAHAHADHVAIGQKNTTDLLGRHQQIGFDFAVAEQCGTYDECGQYAAAYANRVYDIEYDDDGLSAACGSWSGRISIVERDQDVNPQGSSGYVYKTC